MKQSTRLIANTLVTFSRMAITVWLGIVGTRLLLKWLGEVDFGLIGALGATGALLESIKIALTVSSQRHFAYEIGTQNQDKLARTFSTSLSLFLLLGVILWALAISLTQVVLSRLNIPTERAEAAWWVYQLSVATMWITVSATPYRAMLAAKQELLIPTVSDALLGILRFLSVLALLLVSRDKLISFAVLQFFAILITQAIPVVWCVARIPASRFHGNRIDRKEAKELIHFASWSLLGNLSGSIRMQGGVLLVTAYFGPAVNSAYSVAIQVTSYLINLNEAFRVAAQPVIVGAEARQDRDFLRKLALSVGKLSAITLGIFFIPFYLEAWQILELWLVNVPEHSLILLRLSIVWSFVMVMCSVYVLALQAKGNIGWFTRQTLYVSLLVLVATAIGYEFGAPVWFLPAATIAAMLYLLWVSVVKIGVEVGIAPKAWVRKVAIPTAKVLIPATGASLALQVSLAPSLARMLAVGALFAGVAISLAWTVGLEPWERRHFSDVYHKIFQRIQQRFSNNSREEDAKG